MPDVEPVDHFESNREQYEYIQQRLDDTWETFMSTDRTTQGVMLNQSVAYALISAQTPVKLHERGYLKLLKPEVPPTQEEMGKALQDAGVNYCFNKAKYIYHNITKADVDSVMEPLENEDYGTALRAVVDEFKGVGVRKASYALANLGAPRMGCIDTHVAQSAGIDPDDVYSGVVPEKYFSQWREIESQFPELHAKTPSRFLFQWVLFDANRGSLEMHDAWFMSLPEAESRV